MSNKIADRIGAVELWSNANLQARQEGAEFTRIFRWLCYQHVRLFGMGVAMRLLWRVPIPQGDYRIKLSRRHTLYAKALDNVTVSRSFYPAKYPGYCYICKHNCLTVNCAITRWGTGWARYECWAAEMRWIDSHESHRRELLTDTWWGGKDGDGHYLGGAFVRSDHMSWEKLSEVVVRQASIPVITRQEIDPKSGVSYQTEWGPVIAGKSAVLPCIVTKVGDVWGDVTIQIQNRAEDSINLLTADLETTDEAVKRSHIAGYLRSRFMGQDVHSIEKVDGPMVYKTTGTEDGRIIKIDEYHGAVCARGVWYSFSTFDPMPDNF